MDFIRNKRIFAIVGLVSLFLGIILPYFTFSFLGYSESISLWGYWEGKVIMVLTIANALFIFKDLIEKYIPQMLNSNLGQKIANVKNDKISLIPTILVIAFVVYLNIRLDVNSEYLKNGVGFYLLWLGIICLVAHAILYKKQNNQNQIEYNQPIQQQVQPQPVQPMQEVNQPVQPQPAQNNVMQPGTIEQTPSGSNIKYCPSCGKPVDATATTCPACGHMF